MLTREQKLAIATNRHIGVTANAGSGKTRVLVERYISILLNEGNTYPVDPKNIAAITFTRQAAREMLAKVVANIEVMLAQEKDEVLYKRLKHIRERLTYSVITTIHSFCSSLLREYPIEAEVPPNFTEISPPELYWIKKDAVYETIQRWHDSNGDKHDKIKSIIRIFGNKRLETLLDFTLNKQDFLHLNMDYYTGVNSEELCNNAVKIIIGSIPLELIEYLNISLEYAEISLGQVNRGKLPDFHNCINCIKEANSLLKDIKVTFDKNTLIEINNKLSQAAKTKISNGYFFNFIFKGSSYTYLNEDINDIISSMDDLCNTLQYGNYDLNLVSVSGKIIELANEINNVVELKKIESGAIDFDDMQSKTLKLLDKPEVLSQIRYKYKYILVDEFQDTNPIQYEIISRLVSGFNDKDSSFIEIDEDISNNLFIVGDAKQSIYGFRDADVRIFHRSIDKIKNINKAKSELINFKDHYITSITEDEKNGDIKLLSSFRLSPVLTTFVNSVFSNIMVENSGNEFETGYEELVFARDAEHYFKKEILQNNSSIDPKSKNNKRSGFELDEHYGSVSLLICEKEGRSKSSANDESSDIVKKNQLSEADMVSQLILNISGTNNYILRRGNKEEKPLFRDIAVLARSRNHLESLINSLIVRKIPYILHSGSGFFDSQEIIDIISVLKFLNNTNDDISLAGALKSPLFGIDDTGLYLICTRLTEKSIWDRLIDFCRLSADNFPGDLIVKSKRAYRILENYLKIAGRTPIPELVIGILETCGWHGVIARDSAQDQILANMKKFIEYARIFESRGFKNLFDFINEIETQQNMSKESQAAFITGENAVNIMTIHASKGLEFPIVILYDTNSKTSSSVSELIDDTFGLTYPFPVETGPLGEKSPVITPLFSAAKIKNFLSADAESKRTLYVAMTRAKDHLIISSTVTLTKDGYAKPNGFFKLLLEGLKINRTDLAIKTDHFLSKTEILKYLLGEENLTIEVNFNINILKEIDDIDPNLFFQPLESEIPNFMLQNINSSAEGEYFSASKIMSYESSKENYFRSYILGLPENRETDYYNSTDEIESSPDMLLGTLAGSLIHKTLERIKIWLLPDGTVNNTALPEIVDDAIDELSRYVPLELKERIVFECKAIANTGLLQKNCCDLKISYSEYKLTMPWNSDFLTCAFDLLIFIPGSGWEIWDWKTNRIESPEVKKSLIAKYELQMKIYAYFLSQLHPDQELICVRLLFTRFASIANKDEDWTHSFKWTQNELSQFAAELKLKTNEMGRIQDYLLSLNI